jgi:hypothetical protein
VNAKIWEEISGALRNGPIPIGRLEVLIRDAGSDWTTSQLRLFLMCMDGVELEQRSEAEPLVRLGERTEHEQLVAAITAVIRGQRGKPIHVKEVRRRLPESIVTTEEQIKALARRTSDLEVFGPGLIRIKE